MDFGIVFRPELPPEELPGVARDVEAAGLDQLWLWEDCFLHGGTATAAVALAHTGALTVGVGLFPVPLRNPAVVAMETASLARLFPGRYLPVLGHGVLDWMGQVGNRVASPTVGRRPGVDTSACRPAGPPKTRSSTPSWL